MQPTIFVVEDDPSIAGTLTDLLENEGYRVLQTASGADAAVRIATERCDYVLLDIQVDDLSGHGVIRVISDLAVRVPVFVMSAKPDGWQEDMFRNGASACLRKPFDYASLLELLDAFRATNTRSEWPGDVRNLSHEDLDAVSRLSAEELDALPFGVIRLDSNRRIDGFNDFEAQASALSASRVIGARLSDIVPCSEVRSFAGAINDGYSRGELDRVLRFVFPHHGSLAVVSVRLYFDQDLQKLWIFVCKRRGEISSDARRSRHDERQKLPAE